MAQQTLILVYKRSSASQKNNSLYWISSSISLCSSSELLHFFSILNWSLKFGLSVRPSLNKDKVIVFWGWFYPQHSHLYFIPRGGTRVKESVIRHASATQLLQPAALNIQFQNSQIRYYCFIYLFGRSPYLCSIFLNLQDLKKKKVKTETNVVNIEFITFGFNILQQ